MSIPTVNPTNEQSQAIDLLAHMVACSADFASAAAEVFDSVPTPDELLGAGDGSKKCIHYPWYRVENQQVSKPFAVIYEAAGGFNYRRLADGVLIPNGKLLLQLGINVSNDDDPEGEEIRFNNWQGNVIKHVRDRSMIPGELRCTIEQSSPPSRSHPAHVSALTGVDDEEAQIPFWFVEYTVNWDPLA